MVNAPFHFKKIATAFGKSFTEDIAKRVGQKQSEVFSSENTIKLRHGGSWETPANELGDKSGGFSELSIETSISLETILTSSPIIIFQKSDEISNNMHDQMMKVAIATITRSTEKSGNIFDAKGKSFPETYLEMLRSMPVALDKDGEVSLPQLMIHPSQGEKVIGAFQKAGPEFQAQLEAIKAEKKVEAQQEEAKRISRFERRS